MLRNILDYSHNLILVGLIITPVFFDIQVVPYFLIVLVLTTIFNGGSYLFFKENKKLAVPFLAMVFVYICYTLLSPDVRLGLKILERQISLLLVPIVIIFNKRSYKRLCSLVKTYVYIIIILFFFGIIKLTFFVFENKEWLEQISKDNISKFTYLQYKFPHLLNVHPSYWSYLILIALILVLFHLKSISKNNSLKLSISWLILSANLWFLSSRTPLLVYLIIHLLFFLLIDTKKSKIYYIFLLIFIIATFCSLMYLPLLKSKLGLILEDERVVYWPQAAQIIKDNYFLLGEGLGQSGELIKRHIIENGDSRERYLGYDLHNQFLRVYVDMGFLGFISLIGMIFSPLIFKGFRLKKLDFLTISIITMFFLVMLTESLLFRLKGVLIFAVTYTVLLLYNKHYYTEVQT